MKLMNPSMYVHDDVQLCVCGWLEFGHCNRCGFVFCEDCYLSDEGREAILDPYTMLQTEAQWTASCIFNSDNDGYYGYECRVHYAPALGRDFQFQFTDQSREVIENPKILHDGVLMSVRLMDTLAETVANRFTDSQQQSARRIFEVDKLLLPKGMTTEQMMHGLSRRMKSGPWKAIVNAMKESTPKPWGMGPPPLFRLIVDLESYTIDQVVFGLRIMW
jgi:hypothetical protein